MAEARLLTPPPSCTLRRRLELRRPRPASSARLVASTALFSLRFLRLGAFPVASRSALDNARPICRSALSSAANLSRSVRFRTSSYGGLNARPLVTRLRLPPRARFSPPPRLRLEGSPRPRASPRLRRWRRARRRVRDPPPSPRDRPPPPGSARPPTGHRGVSASFGASAFRRALRRRARLPPRRGVSTSRPRRRAATIAESTSAPSAVRSTAGDSPVARPPPPSPLVSCKVETTGDVSPPLRGGSSAVLGPRRRRRRVPTRRPRRTRRAPEHACA